MSLMAHLLCLTTAGSHWICAIKLTAPQLSHSRVGHGHGAENAGSTKLKFDSHVYMELSYEEPACPFREGRVRRHRDRIWPDRCRHCAGDHRDRQRPRHQPERQVHLDQRLAQVSECCEPSLQKAPACRGLSFSQAPSVSVAYA